MIIRDATKKDVKACHKLSQIKEFELTQQGYMPIQFFEFHVGKPLFIVAEEEKTKEIIGYAVADPFEGRRIAQLWYITVHESYRGKGIGDKLLKEMENRCKSLKIQWLLLYSPVMNMKSAKFYRDRGYAEGKKYIEFIKKVF